MNYKTKISIIAFLFSISCYGQKVNIESKGFKKQAGIHVRFEFSISELKQSTNATDITGKFRGSEGILKADSQYGGEDKLNIILITDEPQCAETIQNAIVKVGFDSVYVDGDKIKTIETFNYIKSLSTNK